jgi:ethanolamine ammonia-lyase large subunit
MPSPQPAPVLLQSYKKKVTVAYNQGVYPRLVLDGPEGKDTIRIDQWKVDAIKEYLTDRLQKAS